MSTGVYEEVTKLIFINSVLKRKATENIQVNRSVNFLLIYLLFLQHFFIMSTILHWVLWFVLVSTVMASARIEPSLLEILKSGSTARIVVCVVGCTEEQKIASADDNNNTIDPELLNVLARQCQATVLQLLETDKNRIAINRDSLWPDQTVVSGADLKLVNGLAALKNVTFLFNKRIRLWLIKISFSLMLNMSTLCGFLCQFYLYFSQTIQTPFWDCQVELCKRKPFSTLKDICEDSF